MLNSKRTQPATIQQFLMCFACHALQADVPAGWRDVMLEHVQEVLPSLRNQELSMVLMALPKLGIKPSSDWLEACLDVVSSRFDSLWPQHLANIMWALASLGCLPDRTWMSQFYKASFQILNSFTPAELAITIWSLATLRIQPSDQWLDEFFDQTEVQLNRFGSRDLALTGWALGKMGLRPPQTWMRRFGTAVLAVKQGLTKAQVKQLMYALASFKLTNLDGWRRELYTAAGLKLGRRKSLYGQQVASTRDDV